MVLFFFNVFAGVLVPAPSCEAEALAAESALVGHAEPEDGAGGPGHGERIWLWSKHMGLGEL